MEPRSVISTSEAETRQLGREFGLLLKRGSVVALVGELGAGKTQFVKGVAEAMDIDSSSVSSPTFTIAQEYSGRLPVYHLDLYRLKNEQEFEQSGVQEYLNGDGVCLIEWPENASSFLPDTTILVRIRHLDGDRRQIDYFPPDAG